MADPMYHSIELDQDEEGWWWSACACGWQSPPCPDRNIAADFHGDHRVAVQA